MKKLLIMRTNDIVELLYVVDGDVSNYHVININKPTLVNNIYVGRVDKIIKDSFAFIDIGEDKNGFLDIKDNKEKNLYNSKSKLTIKQGDNILVQVARDGSDLKGPQLTTEIAIGDKNIIVINSLKKMVGVSKKIEDKSLRAKYKKIGENFKYSTIFRSSSPNFDPDDLILEYEKLSTKMDYILNLGNFSNGPKLLYSINNQIIKTATMYLDNLDAIYTNNKNLYNMLIEDSSFKNILNFENTIDLFSSHYLIKSVEDFYRKKIWLKSGGFIVIEETEACTVIDVNSGKNSKMKDKEKMFLKTNLEACEEICRQLIFRNLSGIILVDFIDMKNLDNRNLLIDMMKNLAKNDSVIVTVYGLTRLGFMELTRKKTSLSISKIEDNFRI